MEDSTSSSGRTDPRDAKPQLSPEQLALLRRANAELSAAMDAEMPRPAGKEDWVYRDLPQIHETFWQQFLDIFGEENLHFITYAERRFDDGLYKRGQLFISPAGMERVKAHNAAKASPSPSLNPEAE